LSLEPLLKALRLKIILVDDHDAIAKRGEPTQRDATQVRLNNNCRRNKGRRSPKKPYVPRRRTLRSSAKR
jgi:hypothetical protein